MADSTETKPIIDATEPKLAESETKPTPNPDDAEAGVASNNAPATEGKSAVSDVTSTVVSSATAAATGVKDSMFSMFGGGVKKEKKVEEEDEEAKNEPSGSSKAQKKDADAEEV